MFRKTVEGSYLRANEDAGYLWLVEPANEAEWGAVWRMVEERVVPESAESMTLSRILWEEIPR